MYQEWAKTKIYDQEDSMFYVEISAHFNESILETDLPEALNLILKILTDEVSQKMFEGLASLKVDQNSISLNLTFSRKKEKIHELENLHQIKEWGRHRASYLFYIFREIDKHYPLDDKSIPSVFRELGDMDYLRN